MTMGRKGQMTMSRLHRSCILEILLSLRICHCSPSWRIWRLASRLDIAHLGSYVVPSSWQVSILSHLERRMPVMLSIVFMLLYTKCLNGLLLILGIGRLHTGRHTHQAFEIPHKGFIYPPTWTSIAKLSLGLHNKSGRAWGSFSWPWHSSWMYQLSCMTSARRCTWGYLMNWAEGKLTWSMMTMTCFTFGRSLLTDQLYVTIVLVGYCLSRFYLCSDIQ